MAPIGIRICGAVLNYGPFLGTLYDKDYTTIGPKRDHNLEQPGFVKGFMMRGFRTYDQVQCNICLAAPVEVVVLAKV